MMYLAMQLCSSGLTAPRVVSELSHFISSEDQFFTVPSFISWLVTHLLFDMRLVYPIFFS